MTLAVGGMLKTNTTTITVSCANFVFYFLFSGEGYETLRDYVTLPGNTTKVKWQDFHLHHKDRLKSVLKTMNGALNEIQSETDSFIVDLTPPFLDYIGDGNTAKGDIQYQVRIEGR